MSRPSVVVEGLSKKFGLSLKSALKYGFADSFRRLTGRGKNENLRPGEFWALKDVNFALEPGDALGIMGVNGSGKTTMLRILNGSYTPDAGKVTLRGRIGALIAAGAGFSPLLTGRENVFISGTLLGMHPSEIRKKFDEIVAFADLGDFIDMPIRNYSSGMSVRLGFAVAVLGSPEILLVDEVLAVGDLAFQKKCFERIHTLKNEGTTILLVSHSPGAIWAVCNKGLILNQGVFEGIMEVERACTRYDELNSFAQAASIERVQDTIAKTYDGDATCGTGEVFVTDIRVINRDRHQAKQLEFGDDFDIEIDIESQRDIADAIVRCSIDSNMYRAASILDSYELASETFLVPAGKSRAIFSIKKHNMRPGTYSFTCSIVQKSVGVHLFLKFNMHPIVVTAGASHFFYADFRSLFSLQGAFKLMDGYK